ncbi:solute carrier family 22 member 13-like [Thalassophryne amazonica]|uniref:solute carrier family 22 member 13-like n=1 Tax=Thalassophryne amazonica TaxID=390379 RepID=UPI0014723491|nr:solute carrier family 22 member 13-like [Thalassophryne amazonica]
MADFGEILQNIGDFGQFQILNLVALSFPNFFTVVLIVSSLFIQSDPERHCNTDWILRADPNLTAEVQLNLTVPLEQDGTYSRCQMFVPVDWDIDAIREFGLKETTGCQNGWKYNNTMYKTTIVTDFDLVCDKSHFVEVAQSVSMAGVVLGCIIFGPFAESFGRKRGTLIALVLRFLFTAVTGLCPNVYLYLVSQFLHGIGSGGYRVGSVILATEWIGVSKRSWAACLSFLLIALGQCTFAGMIYFIRDWRLVQFITSALLGAFIICICFVPESARWLLSRGRTEEAKQLIRKVAAINKRSVADALLDKIAVKDVVNKGGPKVIFRSSVLARYLSIIVLTWFALNLSLFCLYFDMGSLGLNIFLTQVLFGTVEIPGSILCIWLLETVGRKMLLMSTALTSVILSMLILAVQGYPIAATSLSVATRFFLILGLGTCNVFVQELFPTSVRQTATGLGATAGRSGGMVAPLVNMLSRFHWVIPITFFSTLLLIGGSLCFILPETRHRELPESTEEAENNKNPAFRERESSSYHLSVMQKMLP